MHYYTTERNTQILIYLLKAHGIKKIIVSPGTTNINFAYSVQQDEYFEVFSVVDERSAAYMACGLATEIGEVVALSCTGATASRNYIPALTEAFYRKIPVLAITSTQFIGRVGNNKPQVIDRSILQKDIARISVNIPTIHTEEEERVCETQINKALLQLRYRGGGPVHINLETSYKKDFSARHLPYSRVIERIMPNDNFPKLPESTNGRDIQVGIFVGAHKKWDNELTRVVEVFCESYNGVVLCDHTSNYKGKYGVLASLILCQEKKCQKWTDFDVLIHIGDVSGSNIMLNAKEVWRVCEDGELCDTFQKLRYVFEMEEQQFFERLLAVRDDRRKGGLGKKWDDEYNRILKLLPELPFSNTWIAQVTSKKIPRNAVLHLGIWSSLSSWNFFELPESVLVYANTGGFGIDGCISSLIGASFAKPDKLFFGVVGDLAFFYDMNCLGNRHLRPNVRLILINNGCGAQFKKYTNPAAILGDEADPYIAARGHFGNQSPILVRNYVENLGFEYMSASSKEEYLAILPRFVIGEMTEKPMLIEIFTDSQKEDEAWKCVNTADSQIEVRDEKDCKLLPLKKSRRIAHSEPGRKIILWGAGKCFEKNIMKVEEHCKVEYVCDNDPRKWGREIKSGIQCIPPCELADMENIFVVILLENTQSAFQVANQLLDMGIDKFDSVYNWLEHTNSN